MPAHPSFRRSPILRTAAFLALLAAASVASEGARAERRILPCPKTDRAPMLDEAIQEASLQ